MLVWLAGTGCAESQSPAAGTQSPAAGSQSPAAGSQSPAAGSQSPAAGSPGVPTASGSPGVPTARVGTPAASQRVRFVPTGIVLPGGARAPVAPASTIGGQLAVPERAYRVGWWDGGAHAGDPFGSVVIAGHVDSATDGIGFFVRLLRISVGHEVVLLGSSSRASYRVVDIRSVPRDALATTSGAFDQNGDHRLVLITCTGRYDRERGGYDRNLVVTAVPVGPAH